MPFLNKRNTNKLLAAERLGIDLWHPEIQNEIEQKGGEVEEGIDNFLAKVKLEKKEHINVNPSLGHFYTDFPLKTLIVYLECYHTPKEPVKWGKYRIEIGPAERWESKDRERTAQIPYFSICLIHNGWRNEILRTPIVFVCNPHYDFTNSSVVYEHRYFRPKAYDKKLISKEKNNLIYIGITKKTWASRWKEHLSSARSNSPYDFHQAIRQFEGIYHSQHTVLSVSQKWEEAMRWEEFLVNKWSLRPKGLNMIPGGKSGIAFAAKYGVKVQSPKKWEKRDYIIKNIMLNAKRRGIPNPAQSLRLTNDPELMRKMVEAREDTFNGNDIAIIRSMDAFGVNWRDIADTLGVKNIYRVRNVVKGKTYKFVK